MKSILGLLAYRKLRHWLEDNKTYLEAGSHWTYVINNTTYIGPLIQKFFLPLRVKSSCIFEVNKDVEHLE
jgi:hypothetical protein